MALTLGRTPWLIILTEWQQTSTRRSVVAVYIFFCLLLFLSVLSARLSTAKTKKKKKLRRLARVHTHALLWRSNGVGEANSINLSLDNFLDRVAPLRKYGNWTLPVPGFTLTFYFMQQSYGWSVVEAGWLRDRRYISCTIAFDIWRSSLKLCANACSRLWEPVVNSTNAQRSRITL